MDIEEHHTVPQRKVWSSAPRKGIIPHTQASWKKKLCRESPGGSGGQQFCCKPAMSPCNKEGQQYSGAVALLGGWSQQWSLSSTQQWWDLIWSAMSSHGIPMQERQGLTWASLANSHKDDWGIEVREGLESWDCSTWRNIRELLSVFRGIKIPNIVKSGSHFLRSGHKQKYRK